MKVHHEFTTLHAILEAVQRRHPNTSNGLVVVFSESGDVDLYCRCTNAEGAYAAAKLLAIAARE